MLCAYPERLQLGWHWPVHLLRAYSLWQYVYQQRLMSRCPLQRPNPPACVSVPVAYFLLAWLMPNICIMQTTSQQLFLLFANFLGRRGKRCGSCREGEASSIL